MTEIILDLLPPISSNAIWRAVNGGMLKSKRYRVWQEKCFALLMTQKQWRGKKIKGQFIATLILDEKKMRSNSDADNKIKAPVDVCKTLNLIVDDNIKYMREVHILLKDEVAAPAGCRLILRSIDV